jgi:hypothetical protein
MFKSRSIATGGFRKKREVIVLNFEKCQENLCYALVTIAAIRFTSFPSYHEREEREERRESKKEIE